MMKKTILIAIVLVLNFTISYTQEYRTYGEEPQSGSGFIKPIDLEPLIEKNIDINGTSINAQIHHNSKIDVVFISGYGSTQKYWYDIITKLPNNLGVLTYDREGYGKSSYNNNPSDVKSAAQQLFELLDQLNVSESVILVGHSYGAHIARIFTSLFPSRVKGLLLIEEPHENLRIEMEKILKPNELEFYHMLNKEMENMPAAHPGMKAETKSMQITFEQLRNANPLPAIPCIVLTAGNKKSFNEFSPETKESLKNLEFNLQRDIARLVPGTKHYIINNSGHNLPLDQPEAVIESVKELLKNN